MRTVFINGEFLPESRAKISVFDRGFLMGDAVYEGFGVLDSKILDFDAHIVRLERSMRALNFPPFPLIQNLLPLCRELMARNAAEEGFLYLQITRGEMDRDFLIPDNLTPNVVMFFQPRAVAHTPQMDTGIHVFTQPDLRWGRCDIKTTQLLYASWKKTSTHLRGADDIWFEKDGMITEGSSNNAFIVMKNGDVITRPTSTDILPGITRATLKTICEAEGVNFLERPFSLTETIEAKEAFITAATTFMVPVVKINHEVIGDGKPGAFTARLRALYLKNISKTAR